MIDSAIMKSYQYSVLVWITKFFFLCAVLFNLPEMVEFVQLTCDGDSNDQCKLETWKNHDSKFSKLTEVGPCNIERVNSITNEEFLEHYAFTKPVIVSTGYSNKHFQHLCEKYSLLQKYGDKKVKLSTANTHSYDKVDMTLKQYIHSSLYPQDMSESGKDTLYFFGDNNYTEWKELFDEYNIPDYKLPGKEAALSFGIGGIGSGVPFHFHGPGFAEVVHGSKRWFLYPYEQKPYFDPDETTIFWLKNEYPNLPQNNGIFQCTIYPGEAIYFPDKWWHATLNLETSVFISSFLG